MMLLVPSAQVFFVSSLNYLHSRLPAVPELMFFFCVVTIPKIGQVPGFYSTCAFTILLVETDSVVGYNLLTCYTGWWFGTFLFSIIYGTILPIFFKMVKTTNQYNMLYTYFVCW